MFQVQDQTLREWSCRKPQERERLADTREEAILGVRTVREGVRLK